MPELQQQIKQKLFLGDFTFQWVVTHITFEEEEIKEG
jgi:hypothetical protein